MEKEKKISVWVTWVKRIVLSAVALVVLFLVISTIIVRLYEKEIKQFAVQKLNEHLSAKVQVKNIELTLIDQFPMASLRFSRVLIEDNLDPDKPDTLFYTKQLYLNLDVVDVLKGNYAVQTIKAKNCVLKPRINEKGQDNYTIWKSDTTENSNSKFSFDLKKVVLKNLVFAYENALQQQYFAFSTNRINMRGNFSDEQYTLISDGDLKYTSVVSGGVSYLKEKNTSLDISLAVDNSTNTYQFKKGDVKIENLGFTITGEYNGNTPSTVNLLVEGKKINLASALTVFPKDLLADLHHYNSKGVFSFTANIKGELSKDKTPRTVIDFNLNNGEFTEKTNNITLNSLSFSGKYSNLNKKVNTILTLKDVQGKLSGNGGNFTGGITIQNLANPIVNANLKGQFDLHILNGFLNRKEITNLNGTIDVDYTINGTMEAHHFNMNKSSGTFRFSEVNLQTNLTEVTFENLTGVTVLNNKNLILKSFSGRIARSDIEATASLRNFFPYLFTETETLVVSASIKSPEIDLEQFINQLKGTEEHQTNSETDTLKFPERIRLKLDASVGEIRYSTFTANNFKALIQLNNKILKSKNIHFSTSEGNVVFKSELEQLQNNHFIWNGKAVLDNINIPQFFASVGNFGQNYLTDKNIRGKGRLKMDFALLYTPDFTLITPSITVKSNINIKNGELINQSTLVELVEYLNSNKLVKAVVNTEELSQKIKRVKFSDFNHTVLISNQTISFPRTTIKTNIAEIGFYGTHTFNNDIDYHFNFDVRNFIKKKKENEFGVIQNDGLGKRLFIRVYGNLDNEIKYSLDKAEKKALKKQLKEEEKKNVKSILKNEFGLFKKDSSLQYTSPKKPEPTFEIESWEEDDAYQKEEQETQPQNKKKPKKKSKWLQKLEAQDSAQTPKHNISIEFDED